MIQRFFISILLLSITLIGFANFFNNTTLGMGTDSATQISVFERKEIVDDIRQLAEIIESTHPDPYKLSGGRIQFHYRLQQLLQGIPESGMTKDELVKLMRPFVAAVGDQHTEIYTEYSVNNSAPGGMPYVFGIIEKKLYIQIPFLEEDQKYYGSILHSIEGVKTPELIGRFKKLEGCENDYFALRRFSRANLLFEPYLFELIPEWIDKSRITFTLILPSGKKETITKNLPVSLSAPLHFAKSQIELPATDESGFLYEFIDPLNKGNDLAYLRVDHMQGFREDKEMQNASGSEYYSEEELQSIPSATELFRNLVVEMKNKETETLIIDIRQNGGGNSRLASILIYFIFGKEMLHSIPDEIAKSGGGHGTMLSQLYFKKHEKISLEGINKNREIPLLLGDINFGRYINKESAFTDDSINLEKYKTSPTFLMEYKSGKYSDYYTPRNIIVLMTPWTSSSGLDMAHYLYRSGAKLLGTPSAQAPNSWGNTIQWELKNSGIKGEVASSFDIAFGDDPEKGKVLPVHYPLTYEKLKSFDFDINAEMLYALELLQGLKK